MTCPYGSSIVFWPYRIILYIYIIFINFIFYLSIVDLSLFAIWDEKNKPEQILILHENFGICIWFIKQEETNWSSERW
jgi:hypothetical protein